MSQITRRQLIKILAAATGTAVLSSVPNKWKTPIVEVGVLPAHAQGSLGTGTITGHVYQTVVGVNQPKSPKISGTPLAGAQVMVDGTSLQSNLTGQDGAYTITNVPAGSRTISCTPPHDYFAPNTPVSDKNVPVTVSASVPAVQDFYYDNNG